YSATLFVARPIAPANPSTGLSSASSTTTPQAAGPGLPREPPSIPALSRSAIQRLHRGRRGGGRRAVNGGLEVEVAATVTADVELGGLVDLLVDLRPEGDVAGGARLTLGLDEEEPFAPLFDAVDVRDEGRRQGGLELEPLGGGALDLRVRLLDRRLDRG